MDTDPDPVKKRGHYIHRISYNRRERMVGLFVFSAFVLFLALLIISGQSQHLFEKRVTFYIDVNSSAGISEGSVVMSQGIEVGTVSALNITEGRKVRITIDVYDGRREMIRSDAKAIVNRLANISNALIEIESDSGDAGELPDEAIIPVEETPSLNDLLLSVARIIQSTDNNKLLAKVEAILPKLEISIENIHNIISQIATGHGVLGAAIFDYKVEKELKTVVTSGSEVLSEAEGIISIAKKRLVQLDPLLKDFNKIAHDVQGATQDLPAMVIELNHIINQANTALTLINEELDNLPGTTVEVRRAMTKVDRLLDSVQNTWPLSNDVKKTPHIPLIPVHPGHD